MLQIAEIWVYVVEDEGSESLMGVQRGGQRAPLVAPDRQQAEALRPLADRAGRPYRLLRFTEREDITDRLPRRSHKNDRVSAVSVLVAADEDGDESIVTSRDEHLPLVALFPSGLRKLIRMAETMGQPFRVLRFGRREEVG